MLAGDAASSLPRIAPPFAGAIFCTAKTAQGEIDLTDLEVRMLSLFFQKEGEALQRKAILERVWGYSSETETRTLDNFIVRLRKYFEPDPANPVYFQTVRGIGYRFSRKG